MVIEWQPVSKAFTRQKGFQTMLRSHALLKPGKTSREKQEKRFWVD